MSKNKKSQSDFNFVFSTNSDFQASNDEDYTEDTLEPNQQKLRVMIDRKKRKGKEVTLVVGFEGSEDDLKNLGKYLKSKCGVGGSVKDYEIMVQGNQKEKVIKLLLEKGYSQTKGAGGN
ncbi:MAG: translation initiation factor [Saprospiraceae bacterium]|jgi:translation initiation factor 1|nr:translation initiation factor [Saprospiraceae bacterium]MDB4539769.1 translation initiation factor [Saprospiraceae bacterium]MDG1435585.1 translation initiation factor [Saprospiraceae bacterium]MDG2418838.1 translation initiation factor [Saprospiraceae bacterium]|tara:strand:- start:145 stop:501 length:357 start_codon:yes stop_codon:yes gene_type:complete